MSNIHRIATTLILLFGILSHLPALSQITAGGPSGVAVVVTPGINLTASTLFPFKDSAAFDMDCDSQDDFIFRLNHGSPAFDIPHIAGIEILDTSIQFCVDTNANYFDGLRFYDLGDTLNCTGNSKWSTDTDILLGNYGCGFCTPLSEGETDKYIYWKQGIFEGWIKLSFDLNTSPSPITLDVHEILSHCLSASLEVDPLGDIKAFPNPNETGVLRFRNDLQIQSYTLYSLSGKRLMEGTISPNGLELPASKGVYLLQIDLLDGSTLIKKIIRL